MPGPFRTARPDFCVPQRVYRRAMTTEQFYLGISIPAVIAFLGIMTSLVTFLVNSSSLNKRLDGIDKRVDELRADMKDGFERVNLTMDAMLQDIADIKAN